MSTHIPLGFELSGVHCGVKQDADMEDLVLVVCRGGAVAVGAYTTNLICAAPVELDRRRTPTNDARVLVINSGNANACTGDQGDQDARRMGQLAATAIGGEEHQALVMSTGVIGESLPMEKIAAGIADAAGQLGDNADALAKAARGMMTTDKVPKVASREFVLSGNSVRILGMAKGAGMIGPKMATMLAVVMTDACLVPDDAQTLLKNAVDVTFNCISVEGHMSTNDTVLLLASGNATDQPLAGEDLSQFSAALERVCLDLARAIPADGEGATHLIAIDVSGCETDGDAFQIAKTIADSPLVKTAVTGCDPNWGRIVSAAGYAGVLFDPRQVSLSLVGTLLYKNGTPVTFDATSVSAEMRTRFEIDVVLRVGAGPGKCRFFTSDLTTEYIHINADYHT